MAALCMIQGARVVATHASFMYHMTSSSSSPGFPFQAKSKQPLNPSSLLLPSFCRHLSWYLLLAVWLKILGPLGMYPFKNLVWRYPFSSACEVSEPKRSSAWSSQTDSNEQQETAPTVKNQVSKVEKLSEEIGGRPPVLTIVAGISVFLTILWVIWSLLSWLVGIFLR